MPGYTIEVEQNLPSRFGRQLRINACGVSIEFPEMDARSDDAMRLAIELQYAAISLINHHQLQEA